MARHRRGPGLAGLTALAAAIVCAAGEAHAQRRRHNRRCKPRAPFASADAELAILRAQTRDLSAPSLFEPHLEVARRPLAAIPQARRPAQRSRVIVRAPGRPASTPPIRG